MNNTDAQGEFLKAVEMNDVANVALLLQSSQRNEISLDVNAINGDQQTPLVVAITSKHMELMSLLLKHGAKSDDALFYCIDTGYEAMVRLICEHLKATSQESLHRTLNTISTDDNLKAVSSPLMYAASEDSQEIVKTLIEYGAEMPDLQTVLDHSKEDTYEQYIASYSWHQAISCEAYLLYAFKDPIQAAIDAGKAVRKSCSVQKRHLRSQYEDLITRLDLFLTKLFAMASSEHEIRALLWNREEDFNDENSILQVGVLPQRIHDALSLKYKQFISSTACTHFVLNQWYMKWKELSVLHFILWTTIVIMFQPVMCIAYIFLPCMWHRLIMKTPYVRFLLHWVSRIYFICLILHITLDESGSAAANFKITDNEGQRINEVLKYLTYWSSLPVVILAYIWILGMTWREIREMCNDGFWNYWTDLFNYTDILQIILYWSALIYYILAYNKENDEVESVCKLMFDVAKLLEADTNRTIYNVSDSLYLKNILETYTICDRFLVKGLAKRDTDQQEVPIFDTLAPNDKILIGDALFGVATVLSFLALLRDFDIVGFVGPLRVSFGGMISDMVRFVILFMFVWISFALGMTTVYSTYDTIEIANCYQREDYSCNLSAFTEFYVSLEMLFWSIFNILGKEELHLRSQYKITSIVGQILYAVYLILVVVVMLNALIAMLSNTYTRVEENSDVKWKVARTNLMARYMANATLPPPFNLLVTLKTVFNWIIGGCRRLCCHCPSDYQKPKNKITDETIDLQQTTSYKALVKIIVDRFVGTYVDSDDEIPVRSGSTTQLSLEMTEMKDSLKTMEKKIELILQLIQDHPAT
ncbi:short transient receptor potential channel 5-like [Amphiura filiformis]|uniref:short transient receptor potential channel 5-like n=1 Tax=Amphiura filiformis TaxID=82378 RepID=UPI003B219A8A